MHGSLIDKLIELVRRMRSPSSKSFDMLGPGTRVAEQASWLMRLQHVGFPFLWGIANEFRAVFGRGASPSPSAEACWFFIGMSAM